MIFNSQISSTYSYKSSFPSTDIPPSLVVLISFTNLLFRMFLTNTIWTPFHPPRQPFIPPSSYFIFSSLLINLLVFLWPFLPSCFPHSDTIKYVHRETSPRPLWTEKVWNLKKRSIFCYLSFSQAPSLLIILFLFVSTSFQPLLPAAASNLLSVDTTFRWCYHQMHD